MFPKLAQWIRVLKYLPLKSGKRLKKNNMKKVSSKAMQTTII